MGMPMRQLTAFGVLLILLAAGVYLRLNQYPEQILLDDEWHVVHQLLLGKSPAELFLFLGHADYSIPLGILYWLEAHWFGLSELAMRWPMLVAGLATLFAFSFYAWRKFSPRVALVFTFLLALSPALVIYSHLARPYALTLFLSFLGLYGFYRYLEGRGQTLMWGGVYCVCAAITIWLHSITGPFMMAPFLLEAIRSLVAKRPGDLVKLLLLAVPAGILVAALVVPPLLNNPEAMALKFGEAEIRGTTFLGAWFMWLGTPSIVCVTGFLALSLLGRRRVLIADRVWQSAALGIVLTAATILVVKPASVNHSLTFSRYLLPAIPLLLMAAACGTELLLRDRGLIKWPLYALCIALAGLYVIESPNWGLAARPNSNINHLSFLFDFRPGHNKQAQYMEEALDLSMFWESLRAEPPNTQLVAVAPFYFESYHWDAIRWEKLGRQRIVPAYLTGFCAERRYGEVPHNSLYRFRNAFYLNELAASSTRRPDWLVFNRPIEGFQHSVEGRREIDQVNRCMEKLGQTLGRPSYEDEFLLAFKLSG